MAKSQRAQKEARKAPQPIPPIPELGTLHKPRKGNRRAAKLIADGVRLWDRRHVERRARRRAIAQSDAEEARRNRERATENFLQELLQRAPSWKAAYRRVSIEPRTEGDVPVEELIAAAEGLSLENPTGEELYFNVAGLTFREHIRLRAALPRGITSYFSYHPRSSTPENAQDFNLHSYDPRERGALPEG